jgi:microcystin-dependent protein
MSQPFLGEIRMFGFNFPPRGWALCNGQILSIAQNTALFALLGTMYGGNGQTTFALPDLRSRVPLHMGQGPGLSSYTLGQAAGSESVTLTTPQLPSHNHPVACNSDDATSGDPELRTSS